MKDQFTFKINRPTGRFRSFDRANMDIVWDKKQVGSVSEKVGYYEIHFMVKSDKHPGWKWIVLKKRVASFDEAKQLLRENFQTITKKFELVRR